MLLLQIRMHFPRHNVIMPCWYQSVLHRNWISKCRIMNRSSLPSPTAISTPHTLYADTPVHGNIAVVMRENRNENKYYVDFVYIYIYGMLSSCVYTTIYYVILHILFLYTKYKVIYPMIYICMSAIHTLTGNMQY